MITGAILEAYDASRDSGVDRSVLCHAPFVSVNFSQTGEVTSCCYNRSFVLGRYPDQTLEEIWHGRPAQALRTAFLEQSPARGCDLCFHQLASGNFAGVLMRNFDRYGTDRPDRTAAVASPRVLEFEISNNCSLECVMCSGDWSSAIRANREHRAPLKNPYDQAFVEQIEAFLPHIVQAKFLGGEPFLINRYYDIWNSIRRVNPRVRLSITTSAAVLPERARSLLEDLTADIVVSIDSLARETYELIRVNARHDTVMTNVEYLLDYSRRRGTALTFAVCPMTHNWRELPDIAAFCEARGIGIHFNTVVRPREASLAALSEDRLAAVIEDLESNRSDVWSERTQRQWSGVLGQLNGWLENKRQFAASAQAKAGALAELLAGVGAVPPLSDADRRALSGVIVRHAAQRLIENNGELACWVAPADRTSLAAAFEDTPETWLYVLHAAARHEGETGTSEGREHGDIAAALGGFVALFESAQALADATGEDNGGINYLSTIRAWIAKQVRAGNLLAVALEAEHLVSRAVANPLAGLSKDHIRQSLADARQKLGIALLPPTVQTEVNRYLGLLAVPRLDDSEGDAGGIKHLSEVIAALYAINLFREWTARGADADLTSRRVHDLLVLLDRLGPAVEPMIPDSLNIRDLHRFIVDSTDTQLAEALRGVA